MQKNIKNQIIEKNNYTAKLLNKLFAGRVSATKNLLQFLCFLYCLFPQDGEIYYTIKKIVEDELLCHKILAEDIVFCGDLPKYKYPDNMLFSVGDIEYLNSPRQMIEVAIDSLTYKELEIVESKLDRETAVNCALECIRDLVEAQLDEDGVIDEIKSEYTLESEALVVKAYIQCSEKLTH